MTAFNRLEEIVRHTDCSFLDEHWTWDTDPHQITTEVLAELRAEVLVEGAALVEDRACDADFTEHPQYCNGLRAAAALLTTGQDTPAPAATGEAYGGELAMLRGLVRTLRVVVREDVDVAEVWRLLVEHTRDDAAAREEATASAAPATPFFQPGRTYTEPGDTTDWKFRCDSITTHPGNGERRALGWRHFRGEWSECSYGEDDFEIHQIADAIGQEGSAR